MQPRIVARTREVTRAVVEIKTTVQPDEIHVSVPSAPPKAQSGRTNITESAFLEQLSQSSSPEVVTLAQWVPDPRVTPPSSCGSDDAYGQKVDGVWPPDSLVNAVPIPMGVDTCGTITPAPTMLTFAGTTAQFLQTATSDSCGSFEVVGTLTRQ